ncbi:MAG: hypothetical protein EPN84_03775 [Legionella sp.]|nr:MAG: hypothetical protein EPN84_03775 [Legionella sp.]
MGKEKDDKTMTDYFVEQKGGDLSKAIAAKKPKNLTYGPLNKNDYTQQFEDIVKAYLARQADSSKPEVVFSIENERLFVEMNGAKLDLSEILKNANLNQLIFNEEDTDNYMVLVHSKACKFPPGIRDLDHIPTAEDYKKREMEGKHPEALEALNLAEKSAINIYSGPFYATCNQMLRGDISRVSDLNSQQIGEVCATIAIGCAGLNKVSTSAPNYSYRIEENFDSALTQRRIDAVNSGGEVIQEMAFFSTADGFVPDDPTAMTREFLEVGCTAILLSDVRGKYIADISQRPVECEYLIAPTQMQWVGHHENEVGTHFFEAKPVQTPDGLTPQQLERNISRSADFKAQLNTVKTEGEEVKSEDDLEDKKGLQI